MPAKNFSSTIHGLTLFHVPSHLQEKEILKQRQEGKKVRLSADRLTPRLKHFDILEGISNPFFAILPYTWCILLSNSLLDQPFKGLHRTPLVCVISPGDVE